MSIGQEVQILLQLPSNPDQIAISSSAKELVLNQRVAEHSLVECVPEIGLQTQLDLLAQRV
jgi:hypothetical protein